MDNYYKKYIKNLADQGSSSLFFNSSKEHASCIMANIFRKSNEEICIVAGNLNGDVSSNPRYQSELLSFLGRGGKLKVLLTNPDLETPSDTISLLMSSKNSGQVSIKNTNGSLVKMEIEGNENEVHWTIGDNKMIRIEHDTKNYLAFGSFNYKGIDKFINQFHALEEVSSKLIYN